MLKELFFFLPADEGDHPGDGGEIHLPAGMALGPTSTFAPLEILLVTQSVCLASVLV